MSFLGRLLREEDAATAVEYAFMLALILLTVFAAVVTVGQNSADMWLDTQTELQSHGFGSGS